MIACMQHNSITLVTPANRTAFSPNRSDNVVLWVELYHGEYVCPPNGALHTALD